MRWLKFMPHPLAVGGNKKWEGNSGVGVVLKCV